MYENVRTEPPAVTDTLGAGIEDADTGPELLPPEEVAGAHVCARLGLRTVRARNVAPIAPVKVSTPSTEELVSVCENSMTVYVVLITVVEYRFVQPGNVLVVIPVLLVKAKTHTMRTSPGRKLVPTVKGNVVEVLWMLAASASASRIRIGYGIAQDAVEVANTPEANCPIKSLPVVVAVKSYPVIGTHAESGDPDVGRYAVISFPSTSLDAPPAANQV